MKKAHLYRLQVEFNNPDIRWDISIVAINTHCVNMWITDRQDTEKFYITHAQIDLILLDYQNVKDTFLASALPDGTIQY